MGTNMTLKMLGLPEDLVAEVTLALRPRARRHREKQPLVQPVFPTRLMWRGGTWDVGRGAACSLVWPGKPKCGDDAGKSHKMMGRDGEG